MYPDERFIYSIMGGAMGRYRELRTEGLQGQFEQDCRDLFRDKIIADFNQNVPEGEGVGDKLWGAMSNVVWTKAGQSYYLGYSFRAAGDVIAAIIEHGDYCNWYCSGRYGYVDPEIGEALASRGWTFLTEK